MFNKKRIKPILLILVFALALLTGCGSDVNDTKLPEVDTNAVETNEDVSEVSEDAPDDIDVVEGDMEVHFIDVGQGDSVLIKQNGSNMLIDAGENNYGELVINYLEEQGVQELDFVVGTHPHSDHIGGLDDVINHFPVGTVIMPEVTHTSKTFEDVIEAIKNKNLNITKPLVGDTYHLGEGEFTIIGPNSESYSNLNDYSVMLRLSFGEDSFMFTGDAETLAEEEAVKNNELLESDVLKAGHHGSETSTIDSFLNEVSPKFAVMQVGEGNQYDHPSQSVITKLQDRGVEVYRTDVDGNIIAISDGKNIRFNNTPSKVPNKSVPVYEDNDEDVEVVEDVEYDNYGEFIGNENSKVLHKKTCGSLPDEHNRVYFKDKDEGIDSGYKACGRCKP